MKRGPTPDEVAILQIAYEQAIYEVYLNRKTIQFRISDRCLAIDSLISQHGVDSWALITAYNPYSQCLSERNNQQRHQKLIEQIEGLQLAYLDAAGKDPGEIWQPELSLFILGISRDIAIAIGRKFQQNAIVYGQIQQPVELIWTDSESS